MPSETDKLEVAIIIPTLNESRNIEDLLQQLTKAVDGLRCDLVVVDDSDDDTVERVYEVAQNFPAVRAIHRPQGLRVGGLAGAVIAGISATSAPIIAVLDGDLQHPPQLVPSLVGLIQAGVCDIALGSRFAVGGSSSGLSGFSRILVARVTRIIAYIACPRSRGVRDPLSGFFAIKRQVVQEVALQTEGFKILLEILHRGNWSKLVEVPFEFQPRVNGTSKASLLEGRRYLCQVSALRRG